MAEAKTLEGHALKAGHRVNLNSGSPWMTVLDVGRDTGMVWCRWKTEAGTFAEAMFPPQALYLHSDEQPKEQK
jgi:uncharacterized protein YodC (DUF2158 family)